jgi:hypothetical protein
MISNDPKFSIIFPIGGFGNHVRWLMLLDDRYQFDINLVDPQSEGLVNGVFVDGNYKSYNFVSMDSKLEFIKTYVYPDNRTWHNWLVFEWKYREQIQEILKIDHSYNFKQHGPLEKELYLTITPDLAVNCYLKFNSTLNGTSPGLMKKTIANFNYVVRQYCLKFSENSLSLNVDILFNETLDKELYQQIINFFRLDYNYDQANQVHKLWYNLHRKAEKEIILDLQKIYLEESQ